jgi:acyl-coenzyme A synthetase/AMP-(fatty) acid ligase
VAYLVAGSEPKPGMIAMKMFCSQNLPAYMNPDSFVFIDSLPRTSTNKVDYQALMRTIHQEAQEAGSNGNTK